MIEDSDLSGGIVDLGGAGVQPFPEMTESDPSTTGGFLHSTVAGRTDHLQVRVGSGGYVVPADVVSGIGEGNSLSGAKFLEQALKTGPWNVEPIKIKGHAKGPPRAPAAPRARGGATAVPILGAGGEYVIPPQTVLKIGGGDMDRGHRILDKWVVAQRKAIVKEMSRLPGPVKE